MGLSTVCYKDTQKNTKKQKYKIEKYLTEIFGSRSRGLFRKFGVRF